MRHVQRRRSRGSSTAELKRFVEATKDLTAEERAVRLEADDDICGAHDEAAREGQTRAPDREDQVRTLVLYIKPV